MRVGWNRRSVRSLAGALACGVVGVALLRAGPGSGAPDGAGGGPLVPQVIASHAIDRGSVVLAGDLAVADVPARYAQPGAFRTVREAAGRVALTDLSTGEAATQTRLARVRAGPVASLIPEGLRAFAVPTSLPAGAVMAGDHVDILATYASGQPHTELVVAGVEVLMALGRDAVAGASGTSGGLGSDAAAAGITQGPTLLVLVPPDQEERLASARAFADLTVAIVPADEPPP
jgi:Flp pilus assembly protein CpaB